MTYSNISAPEERNDSALVSTFNAPKSQNVEYLTRPRIGLLTRVNKNGEADICDRWQQSLENNGMDVVPILASFSETFGDKEAEFEKLVRDLDGIYLPGGREHMQTFGYQRRDPSSEDVLTVQADFVAGRLISIAKETKTPVLGVCLGAQRMNGWSGGKVQKMHEDHARGFIEGQLKGIDESPVHPMIISEGGLLFELLGQQTPDLDVNSAHEEGMFPEDLGKNLRLEALAEDGSVEAFSLQNHPFFLGIQSHTEYKSHPLHHVIYGGFREKALERHLHLNPKARLEAEIAL